MENEHLFSTGAPWLVGRMPSGRDLQRRPGPRHRHGLQVRATATSLSIELSESSTITFHRWDGRCAVRLGFGRSAVGPDVSVQPGAVAAVVDQQARLGDVDPNRWRVEIVRSMRGWDPSLEWCPLEPGRLVAAVGALTHPLLGELYEQGGAAIGDVPRWASPVLRARSASDASRQLVGDEATRRLTRTLARSLAPVEGHVDLAPLSLAVAGVGLIGVEHLANLLDAGTTPTSRARPLPSVDQVRSIRHGLALYPTERRARLLVDAIDDPPRLADALTQLPWIEHRVARPLPSRVEELVELCRRLVPVVAEPPGPSAGVPVAAATPVAGPAPAPEPVGRSTTTAPEPPHQRTSARPRQLGRQPLHAPAAPQHAPAGWVVPTALRTISGVRRGDLTFVVPTSATELRAWSRELGNCLDTYVAATAHERSWLIGLRHDDDLVGCIEICPDSRRLRQAQGPRNRALPRQVYDLAVATLADHDLLRIHRNT